MRAELTEKLEGGATLITPNRRLALYLKREFDEAQFAAGRAVWPTADILPWTAWLERAYEDALYSRLAPDLPLLLSSSQELALWELAIRDSEFQLLAEFKPLKITVGSLAGFPSHPLFVFNGSGLGDRRFVGEGEPPLVTQGR